MLATKNKLYSLAGFEKTITFCTPHDPRCYLGALRNNRPLASSVATHTAPQSRLHYSGVAAGQRVCKGELCPQTNTSVILACPSLPSRSLYHSQGSRQKRPTGVRSKLALLGLKARPEKLP
jgi:hypothetical protein